MVRELGLSQIIGHRGAAALAPENTLAALRAARAAGCVWAEVDVRLTADAVPVLLHDATLERTTSGRGRLADSTLASLRGLDAGAWFADTHRGEPLPTLEEAMAEAARLGLRLNLELKSDAAGPGRDPAAAVRAVLDVLRRTPMPVGPPLISSFDAQRIEALSRTGVSWPLALIARRPAATLFERATALRCAAVACQELWVSEGHVAIAHKAHLALLAYTVNDPHRARRLLALGVASVFTDNPAAIGRHVPNR